MPLGTPFRAFGVIQVSVTPRLFAVLAFRGAFRGRRGEQLSGMRLVTLNTWGMRGDWGERLPVFREVFRALDADIVTLQETRPLGVAQRPLQWRQPRNARAGGRPGRSW